MYAQSREEAAMAAGIGLQGKFRALRPPQMTYNQGFPLNSESRKHSVVLKTGDLLKDSNTLLTL